MKFRSTITLFLTLAVFSLTASALADGITKRVRFARGKHSATLSGAVVRGDRDKYLVGARAGQTLTLKITSLENNAVFQVVGPDGEYLDGTGEGDDATQFTSSLPGTGDYKIVVGGTRGNASYRLTVTAK